MFTEQIKNLIKNNKDEHIIELDIICEGGAINGYNQLGAMLYIKQMENMGRIKINRISGCSVGSLVGASFLLNKLDSMIDIYSILLETMKKNLTFSLLKEEVKKIVYSIDEDELFDKLNNRLFVNYFDVEKRENVTKSTYKNKQEIFHILWSSSYIPYLSGDTFCHSLEKKDEQEDLSRNDFKRIDGGTPFIFHDREKHINYNILYINISNYEILGKLLSLKNQKTCDARILKGILEAHSFFCDKENTKMLSYMHTWNKFDYIVLRIKEIIVYLLFIGVTFINEHGSSVYIFLNKYTIPNRIFEIIKMLYRDILLETIF